MPCVYVGARRYREGCLSPRHALYLERVTLHSASPALGIYWRAALLRSRNGDAANHNGAQNPRDARLHDLFARNVHSCAVDPVPAEKGTYDAGSAGLPSWQHATRCPTCDPSPGAHTQPWGDNVRAGIWGRDAPSASEPAWVSCDRVRSVGRALRCGHCRTPPKKLRRIRPRQIEFLPD